jgi:hypothetical protein
MGGDGPPPAIPAGAGLPVSGPRAGAAPGPRPVPAALTPPRPAFPSPHQALLDRAEPLLRAADPAIAARARALALDALRAGPAGTGAILEFGMGVQMEVAALADALVSLARRGDATEIAARMGRIAEIVRALGPDALLAPRPRNLLERVFDAGPGRENPEAALRAVDVEAAFLRSHLPALRESLSAIEQALAEDLRLRDALEAHILAFDILLAEARASGASPRAIEAMEDRQVALRRSRLINQTDAAQLEMMERTTRRLVEQVGSVVTDLVGAWKRHCAAALAVGSATAPGAAAASLAAARARLLDAIAAAR